MFQFYWLPYSDRVRQSDLSNSYYTMFVAHNLKNRVKIRSQLIYILRTHFCVINSAYPICYFSTHNYKNRVVFFEGNPKDSMDLNSSLSSNTIPVVSTLTKPTEDAKSSPTSSDEVHKPICYWPGVYHSPVTDALWNERVSINERLFDIPDDAPPPTELLTRTPSESRTTIVYALSSDSTLREQYKDPWNEFRIGKLLEDLDALAGTITFKVSLSLNILPLVCLLEFKTLVVHCFKFTSLKWNVVGLKW